MKQPLIIILLIGAIPLMAATPVQHFITLGAQGAGVHVDKQHWGGEAAVDVGYGLQRNHFLFSLAMQAGYQNVSQSMADYSTHEPAIDDQQQPYILNSIYTNQQSRFQMIHVAMPVLLGGTYRHFYGLLGPVVGMRIYGHEQRQSTLTTTGDYDPMLETFHDMPNHGFYTRDISSQAGLDKAYLVNAMVEIGARLPIRSSSAYSRVQHYVHVAAYANYPLLQTFPMGRESFSAGVKCAIWWNIPTSSPCRCVREN